MDKQTKFLQILDIFSGLYGQASKRAFLQTSFEQALKSFGIGNWEIVGISAKALEVLVEGDFKKGLVQRGHGAVTRSQRFKAIMTGEVAREQALAYYLANDATTLVTAAENKINGCDHWSEVLAFPENFGEIKGTFRANFNKWQKELLIELKEKR